MTPANNTGLGAILRGSYYDAELNGKQESTLTYYRSTNGGATWAPAGFSSRNTTQNYVNLSGVQSISRLTLSDAANPLPLDLLSWQAVCSGAGAVRLEWTLAGAAGPEWVVVEKSSDGRAWQQAVTYPATGVPAQYLDAAPAAFYRLALQAPGGAVDYSPTLAPNCADKAGPDFRLLENPVHDRLAVVATSSEATVVQFRLLDGQGRLVHRQAFALEAGAQTLTVPVSDLAAGLYQVGLTDDHGPPLFAARVVVHQQGVIPAERQTPPVRY